MLEIFRRGRDTFLMGHTASSSTAAAVNHNCNYERRNVATTSTVFKRQVYGMPFTVEDYRCKAFNNTTDSDPVLTVMRNAVATTQTITITAGVDADFISVGANVVFIETDDIMFEIDTALRTAGGISYCAIVRCLR